MLRKLRDNDERLFTTRFNLAELWVGVHQSDDRQKHIRIMRRTLLGISVIDFSEPESRRFGAVEAHLRRIGRPAGEIDALIAAICLVHGESIVTRNPKHFADVPGLVVETY